MTNIVVIMTDQHRADACAREGFALDTTPFLDKLARTGTWFDHAYTATPVCTPARTSFLTGRFPSATTVWVNEQQDNAVYCRDVFDVMNDTGYETALIGKNHSYLTPEKTDHWIEYSHWGAVDENATESRTAEDERWEAYMDTLSLFNNGGGWDSEPAPTSVETQCAYRCIEHAQDWIRSLENDCPFFMWLSLPEPHNPYQVSEPYFSMFPPQELPPVSAGSEALADKRFKWQWLRRIGIERASREAPDADYDTEILPQLRSNYYGMLRMIDDQVRRFVEFLEKENRREETLLVFLSDHGDFAGDYGLVRKGVDLPESTVRIPMFFNGPGIETDPEPTDAHVSIVDLMPTLCDVVGAEIPPGVQGRSLQPLLSGIENASDAFPSVYAECGYGGSHSAPEDVPDIDHAAKNELNAHGQTGRTAMVRREEWKLVYDMEDGSELYRLNEDSIETNDLSNDPAHADVLRELYADLTSWSLHIRDTLPEKYPVTD